MKSEGLEIYTPEGVPFSLPLAGAGTRLVALVVDLLAILALGGLVFSALKAFEAAAPDAIGGIVTLVYFVLSTAYGIVLEIWWNGQTLGKRLLGLRVMDCHARPATATQIVVRNLLRPVDSIPVFYLAGAIACWLTRHRQRLGDLAAGTVVVRTQESLRADWSQLTRAKFNSLREHPALAARLRQRTAPELAALALDAVLRREELSPDARLAVFAALAARLRTLVEFPAHAVESLSDEQYVHRAVEVLYSTSRVT
ncbi:MAG: RDD family protein [Acidobacteria bacterium]|nr:RDD family protein [Acidobacteriota bacterium]